MLDYMTNLKKETGYESLKSDYAKKFPALGKSKPASTKMMEEHEDDSDETESESITEEEITVARDKINDLQKQLEEQQKQMENDLKTTQENEQKHFNAKRAGDLARNKINTATKCLDKYLEDNLCDPTFDEFSPVLKFLVTQYSALLYSPDFYLVNSETNEVILTGDFLLDLETPETKDKLDIFKEELKSKLELDLSVRRERRISISGLNRSRSTSQKRGLGDSSQSKLPKAARTIPPNTSII